MAPENLPRVARDFLGLGLPSDYNITGYETHAVHGPEPSVIFADHPIDEGNGMAPADVWRKALGMQTFKTVCSEGLVEQSAENMPYTSISDISKGHRAVLVEESPVPHFLQDSVGSVLRNTSTIINLESRMHLYGLKEKKGSASLTIFYGGCVNVLENVSVEEAHAIMNFAASADSKCNVPNPSTITAMKPEANASKSKGVKSVVDQLSFAADIFSYPLSLSPDQPMITGSLPQAQKASLNRFFKRRKTRMLLLNSPYVRNELSSSNAVSDHKLCDKYSKA